MVACNIGKDITDVVNSYVYSNFGHGAEDFTIQQKEEVLYFRKGRDANDCRLKPNIYKQIVLVRD